MIAILAHTVWHTTKTHFFHKVHHSTLPHPVPPHHPILPHLERQSYDFPSDDTKGATTSDGKSKPSRRFSLKQGGLLDDDESQQGSASKSCCAVC